MNIRRVFGLTLMPVSCSLIAISSVAGGIASAVDNDISGDEAAINQAASASVATEEVCTWWVANMPANATMTAVAPGSGNNSAGEDEYDGTTFDMAKVESSDMQVYTSGNLGEGTATSNTECTFYAAKKGIAITHTLSGIAFTASYYNSGTSGATTADTAMDFDLSSSLPFTVDGTKTTCFTAADADEADDGWTQADSTLYSTTSTGSTNVFLTLPYASTAAVNTTSSSDRCDTSITFAVTVPGDMTPSQAGKTYVWSGPNLVNTITLPTS
jgi:hypothetical protein